MHERETSITEDELHAYVDGVLPAERHAAVEEWLSRHPEDAARVAQWRTQAELIRAAFDPVAEEPVPERLRLDRLARQASMPRRFVGMVAAAACAAFMLGGAAGWFARGAGPAASPSAAITADALAAHKLYVVEVRHPVEVGAAERTHLLQWLSKRVDHPLQAPDLDRLGLKLIGGRLLPGPTGAAAFFMYERGSGERVTLFCAKIQAPPTAMRYATRDGAATVSWVDGDVAYVLSGTGDREALMRIARTAYEQVETPARKS